MRKTDPESLGPWLAAGLRHALDRIEPPSAAPRYLSAGPEGRVSMLRLTPFALAIALFGILGLTAWAATGSTDPAVWTNRVETVINPPAPSPTPESNSTESQPNAAPAAPAHPATTTPTQQPESGDEDEQGTPQPSSTPRPSPSPDPEEDPWGSSGG